ncbi:MAG: CBS domain-containing protein [Gammaproteobacteria bacterium]
MKVRDIMSTKVVTVSPSTTVRDIAGLMVEKHVSGLPVLSDSGTLVGIVSEGDLLRRPELGTQKHRRRWVSFFSGVDEQAREFTKTHALRAGDVMTEQVIHVSEQTPLGDVVGLMEKHNIKRLPVLSDGKLVGIVSRADLLRALAARQANPIPPPAESDATIRAAMNEVLKNEEWAMSAMVNVIVSEGAVHLWGVIDSDDQRQALRVAAENIPGVTAVEEHLSFSLPT